MSRVRATALTCSRILDLIPQSHRKGARVSIRKNVQVVIPMQQTASRSTTCWGMPGVSVKRGTLTVSATHTDIERKLQEVMAVLRVA